jgi:hypothetical protein
VIALTDTKVRNAPTKDQAYRLSDSVGLYLYISPAGGKLWRWKYRFGVKEKLMSFGSYPEVSLAAARAAHLEERKRLAAGTDPMAERKAQKNPQIEPEQGLFCVVAKAWFEKWKKGKSARHTLYTERRMETDILPCLGNRTVESIQPPDVLAMIQALKRAGRQMLHVELTKPLAKSRCRSS